MSRVRLFVDQPIIENTVLEIEEDQARYVGRVLRLRPKDKLTLFNGQGGEYPAIIQSFTRKGLRVAIGARVEHDTNSNLSIHLLQGISRGDRMDTVAQKATELGVARITPLITTYSVVKMPKDRAKKRLQRWRGILTNACEQCGRNTLPIIDEPISFADWLSNNEHPTGERLILNPNAPAPLSSVPDISRNVTVLIGPEGGFSDNETELAVARQFTNVRLGPRILRTETAALAMLAALQTLHGDLADAFKSGAAD